MKLQSPDEKPTAWVDVKELAANSHCLLLHRDPAQFLPCQQCRRSNLFKVRSLSVSLCLYRCRCFLIVSVLLPIDCIHIHSSYPFDAPSLTRTSSHQAPRTLLLHMDSPEPTEVLLAFDLGVQWPMEDRPSVAKRVSVFTHGIERNTPWVVSISIHFLDFDPLP